MPEESLQAAKDALAAFKDAGDKSGQAIASNAVALAHSLKDDGAEAEKAAKEGLSLFKELKDGVGEAYAASLLDNAKFVGMAPSNAKVFFDDDFVAHVEVSEGCTQESLESCVNLLHNWSTGSRGREIKAITLHLEGKPCPVSMQSYAMKSGAFIMGLRSVGLPVTLGAWGHISGPSWGLVCACDYRVAAVDTVFHLPIWGPPECLAELFGQSVASQLCMNTGQMSALSMLELGVLNQAQKDRDTAERAAAEFAKRVGAFPSIACKQTLCLMSPAAEKFAMSFPR